MEKGIPHFQDGFIIELTGFLYEEIYENRDSIYHALKIVSDGFLYDMCDIRSIECLPIPNFRAGTVIGLSDVTGMLDYVLRMIASNRRREGLQEISVLCLKKASEMMEVSGNLWRFDDYVRLCNWLYEDGRFQEGNKYMRYFYSKYYDSATSRLNANSLQYYRDKIEYEMLKRNDRIRAPRSLAAYQREKGADAGKYSDIVAYVDAHVGWCAQEFVANKNS